MQQQQNKMNDYLDESIFLGFLMNQSFNVERRILNVDLIRLFIYCKPENDH